MKSKNLERLREITDKLEGKPDFQGQPEMITFRRHPFLVDSKMFREGKCTGA